MDSKVENIMALVNETFVSLYLYILLAMTGGTELMSSQELKYSYRELSGTCLICVVFISVFFNVAKLIAMMYLTCKLKCAKCCQKKAPIHNLEETQSMS